MALGLHLAVAVAGCRRSAPPREVVMRDLVTARGIPMYRELSSASRKLSAAVRVLTETPATKSLLAARQALVEAIVAIKRTAAFRSGPAGETSLHFRAAYFPVRAEGIEAAIAGDKPID